MNRHLTPDCDCQSGNRTLVLLAEDLHDDFTDFFSLETKDNWAFHQEFGVIEIEVGSGKRFSGAHEVFNFLRAVVPDETRLQGMRAAWLDRRQRLTQQLLRLGAEAQPLSRFESSDEGATELLDVLRHRRIESWFQPVVEARGGRVWGYECLMRGRRLDGALISAPQLLEWAQQENLKFMLDRVCRETHLENAGRLGAGPDCRFLINFLPTAIYQPEYCLRTSLAAMRRSGLEPRQVIFEVVESEKIDDPPHLHRILEYYRRHGFGIALDDMGSGYAGLALLGDLQPDLIKIDRAIVARAVDSKTHLNICSSLVRLGRDNGQLVLAEGVETETEVALMESLGVDLMQGFYFGRPAPAPEVRRPARSV